MLVIWNNKQFSNYSQTSCHTWNLQGSTELHTDTHTYKLRHTPAPAKAINMKNYNKLVDNIKNI